MATASSTASSPRWSAPRRSAGPRSIRAGTYAKRFAAKEAASKALGTGFRAGVFWRDLGVVNLSLRPADAADDRRRGRRGWPRITPAGHTARRSR